MRHFKETEFSDYSKMDPELLVMLDKLRENYGSPIIITSSYRDPETNKRVGGKPDSQHLYGRAVDIAASGGSTVYDIVRSAIQVGFNRIGISRKNNFIHLDIGDKYGKTPSIWTY